MVFTAVWMSPKAVIITTRAWLFISLMPSSTVMPETSGRWMSSRVMSGASSL